MTKFAGPFDLGPFPEKLTATAITPEAAPKLEGYSLLTDLASKKGFTETVWLTLKGELPTADQLWAFEKALYWLSPVHVGEAPTHAAVVTRVCDSWTSSAVMLGSIGLAERARTTLTELAAWRAYLTSSAKGPIPEVAFLSAADANLEQACTTLFKEWTEKRGPNDLMQASLNYRREAVALLLLHELEIREPILIEFLSVWAALPLVMAEVKNVKAGDVGSYPARLPEITYAEAH